jgi:2-oxo-4-hydroxy-4-carboxy--5-ureidoimidazoline (OHCU) decarboxylase
VERDFEEEFAEALAQIARIAGFRLRAMIED